jgi:hypothetical protein
LYFEKISAEGLSEPNLKLPLEMESVQELFGKLAIDVDLPRQSKNTGQPVSGGSPETFVQRRQQLLRRLSPDADVDVDIEAEEEEAEDADETIEIDVPDDVYAEKRRTISKSCMQGYKSALKHYVEVIRKQSFEAAKTKSRANQAKNQLSLNSWCDKYIKAYGRIVASKKTNGVMKVKEGKSEISFSGYSQLNLKFIAFFPLER